MRQMVYETYVRLRLRTADMRLILITKESMNDEIDDEPFEL